MWAGNVATPNTILLAMNWSTTVMHALELVRWPLVGILSALMLGRGLILLGKRLPGLLLRDASSQFETELETLDAVLSHRLAHRTQPVSSPLVEAILDE